MADVKLSVSAPKEVVDVFVTLERLVSKVVAKEPALQILSEELGTLVSLVSELGAVVDAVSLDSDETLDAAALFGRRIAYLVLGKSVKPVVVS